MRRSRRLHRGALRVGRLIQRRRSRLRLALRRLRGRTCGLGLPACVLRPFGQPPQARPQRLAFAGQVPPALPQRGAPVARLGQLAGQRPHPASTLAFRRQGFEQPPPLAVHLRYVRVEFGQRLPGDLRFLRQRVGSRGQTRTPRVQVSVPGVQVPLPLHQPGALRRLPGRRLTRRLQFAPRVRQFPFKFRAAQGRLGSPPAQLLRRLGQQRRQHVGGLLLARLRGLEVPVDDEEPVLRQRDLALVNFALEVRAAFGHLGLLAQSVQPRLDLGGQVPQALQVAPRLRQPPPGLIAPRVEPRHPGRLFQKRAPVLRPLLQHLIDLALVDHRVPAVAGGARAHQVQHVAQAHARPVDRVLRRARPEQPPPDHHLAELGRQPVGRVIEGQPHIRHAGARPRLRAAENHVLRPTDAQQARRLFAHRPANRVGKVALARAVRSHDGRNTGPELQRRAPRERLEPLEINPLQIHPSRLRRRAAPSGPRARPPVPPAACSSRGPWPASGRRLEPPS